MRGYAAIAAYWAATFRGELDAGELKVFERVLVETDVEDAVAAIDDVAASGGYPPTPQRIAELAEGHRKSRALKRLSEEGRALPPGQGYVRFAEFLRDDPDMAARVKALDVTKPGAKTNPIRDALAGLLRNGL
jgi:hypothetical protein